ncbi:MAG: GntR family transcriptional regulator [Bacteroidia bacterium]|nr:GntR family transcriptional regulator [Bacteroidia bacterium]MCO5254854.1 S1-like domain-containing RNA-binding protein [Bacteroidota bacterium]MCZ2128931.1 GntR family transcriptional regulator [Bacteroidia bacterium]
MFDVGNYNELIADEFTPHGLFLINESNPEKRILLPGVELSQKEIRIGDKLNLFVYLDSENRPIATLKEPKLTLFTFGFLQIKDINKLGAFADCGLPKDLFIPYRELRESIDKDDFVIVFMYFDTESNRLVGTTKVDAVLSNENVVLTTGQEVDIMVWKRTDLGYKLIINDLHEGLVFFSDIFKEIRVGQKFKAYVKQIRPDNKIDISLQKIGSDQIKDDAFYIYGELLNNNGTLPFSDKSDPETIIERFGMSKKAFKRAVGSLYKNKKINLEENSISVIKKK